MSIVMNKFKGDGDTLILNELGASAVQATFDLSFVTTGDGSSLNGKNWTFSTDRNDYYVWYNVTGAAAGPSDPAVAARVGIPVTLSSAAAVDGSAAAAATLAQLSKLSEIGITQTASVLTITVKEHGAIEDVVAASPFAVDASTLGVARITVGAKFVIHTSAGLVEAIIDDVNKSVWDLAGASAYRVEDINAGFGGSRLFHGTNLVGAAADDPVKADNIAPSYDQREILGSNIHGVS